MSIRKGAGVLLIAGALPLAGYVGLSSVQAGAAVHSVDKAKAKVAHVTISNFMFSPMKLTVTPGETIEVTNKDSATHTLSATNGKFNTGNVTQNHTKSIKAPTKRGTYHYICNIHQYMMGTITVK
jgi:plastocyanin